MSLSESDLKLDRVYKFLVILVIVIGLLIVMKDMLVPMAFAALFAVVLLPVEKRIERKTGRVFSILIVLLGAFSSIGLVVWFIISQITELVVSLPDINEQLTTLINETSRYANDLFKISIEDQTRLLKEGLNNLSAYIGSVFLSTSYLLYFVIQVPIYIFIFLLYREKFKSFLLAVRPDSTLGWKDEIQAVVRNYISGLMLVVLIAGALNSIGLLALGIDHAIFFGFLSGALTMIPYVGITIGATLPTMLAIVTKDSVWYPIGVIGVHAFVQFLEANFITPRITGSKISINALAAIVALLIGGMIWGIAGMILAIPATGIIKIILAYSETLKPLVILMEDKSNTQAEIQKTLQEVKEDEEQEARNRKNNP